MLSSSWCPTPPASPSVLQVEAILTGMEQCIIFSSRHCEGDNLLDAGCDLPVFRHLYDKHARSRHLHDGHHVARGEKGHLGGDEGKFCGEVVEKRFEGKLWSERVSAQPV